MIGLVLLMTFGVLGASFVSFGSEDADDENQEDSSQEEQLSHVPSPHSQNETTEVEGFLFSSDELNDANALYGTDDDDVLGERLEGSNATAQHIFGGDGDDHLFGTSGDVLIGADGKDTFESSSDELINIVDFSEGDTIVIRYNGEVPQLDAMATDEGTSLFADGRQIINLNGVYSLDFSLIRFEHE